MKTRRKSNTCRSDGRGGLPKTRGNFALAHLRQICGEVDPSLALQKQFAAWIGVPYKTFVAYENGSRRLPLRVRAGLADLTGVDQNSLEGAPEDLCARWTGGPYTSDVFRRIRAERERIASMPVADREEYLQVLAAAYAGDVEMIGHAAEALLRIAYPCGLFTSAHVALFEAIRRVATEMGLVAEWEKGMASYSNTIG